MKSFPPFFDPKKPVNECFMKAASSYGSDYTLAEIPEAVVTVSQWRSLEPKKWLTSDIINFYTGILNGMIKTHCHSQHEVVVFSSFLYEKIKNNQPVQRWFKKIDTSKVKRVVFPVNVSYGSRPSNAPGGIHWFAVCINIEHKKIVVSDSLPHNDYVKSDKIKQKIVKDVFNMNVDDFQTTFRVNRGQTDGYQCGVWTCAFLWEFVAGETIPKRDLQYLMNKQGNEVRRMLQSLIVEKGVSQERISVSDCTRKSERTNTARKSERTSPARKSDKTDVSSTPVVIQNRTDRDIPAKQITENIVRQISSFANITAVFTHLFPQFLSFTDVHRMIKIETGVGNSVRSEAFPEYKSDPVAIALQSGEFNRNRKQTNVGQLNQLHLCGKGSGVKPVLELFSVFGSTETKKDYKQYKPCICLLWDMQTEGPQIAGTVMMCEYFKGLLPGFDQTYMNGSLFINFVCSNRQPAGRLGVLLALKHAVKRKYNRVTSVAVNPESETMFESLGFTKRKPLDGGSVVMFWAPNSQSIDLIKSSLQMPREIEEVCFRPGLTNASKQKTMSRCVLPQ